MNDNNLIPLNRRTESERKEIAQKGGNASAESRRFASSMKTALKYAMKEKRKVHDIKRGVVLELNGHEMAALSLMDQIEDGNVRAMEFAAKLLGELTDSVKVDQNIKINREPRINIDDLSEETRMALLELAEKEINKH